MDGWMDVPFFHEMSHIIYRLKNA